MRYFIKGILAACLTLLVAGDFAHAQRYFGRGRTGVYINTPGFTYGYGPTYSYYGPAYRSYAPGFYSVPYYYSSPYTYTYPRYYGGYPSPYTGGYYYYSNPPYYYYQSSSYQPIPSSLLQDSSNDNGGLNVTADQSKYTGQQSLPPNSSERSALLRVLLPTANAKVWVDDEPTRQTGLERFYTSPPLDAGKTYAYTVRASWMANGQEVVAEKRVKVQPGQESTVDFAAQMEEDQEEEIPAPRPLASPPR